jgi:hypothetical protein
MSYLILNLMGYLIVTKQPLNPELQALVNSNPLIVFKSGDNIMEMISEILEPLGLEVKGDPDYAIIVSGVIRDISRFGLVSSLLGTLAQYHKVKLFLELGSERQDLGVKTEVKFS